MSTWFEYHSSLLNSLERSKLLTASANWGASEVPKWEMEWVWESAVVAMIRVAESMADFIGKYREL